jgi:hypothetical protein
MRNNKLYEYSDSGAVPVMIDPFANVSWPGLHVPPINLYNAPALNKQVGGGHYKSKGIQPIEYIHANKLNYSEGAIVKYITRWRDKGGIEDLEKIKHYVDLLIDMERKYGSLKSSPVEDTA